MEKKLISIVVLGTLVITSNSLFAGWTIQPSPTTQNLYSVSSVDAGTWIAVGDAGTIIRSNDGGITWTQITSPVADGLRGVSMRGTTGLAVGISGRVVRSTNSGLSWTEMPRPTTRNLYSVSIGDIMSVAVGHEGTILVSSDNGLTWTARGAGTASALFGVSVNGMSAVGVGSAAAVVMTINGGSGWGLTVIGGLTTTFYGTSFVNTQTGWLVGSTVSPGNVLARSNNGGFSWTAQAAPVTDQLFGVSFVAMDTGTAVGGNGTIIHTINGGLNWVSQLSGTNHILNSVSFINTNLGITVGNSGTILRTTNGGVLGLNPENNAIPTGFELSQNYPNPFNPSTEINYRIPERSFVRLIIFNELGSEVKEIINGFQKPGNYSINFDGENFPSGAYFYELTAKSAVEKGEFEETKKMMLIK